jgi:hypothetical protein
VSGIRITTLTAEYVEAGWNADDGDLGQVQLHFGSTLVASWPADQTYFRGDTDSDEYVEQFVAGKLAELFGGSA